MAEPEEAGPVPDGHVDQRPQASRPVTIAEAVRQIKRQRAPLEAAIRRSAEFGRQIIDGAMAPALRIKAEFGLDEEPDTSGTPAQSVEPAAIETVQTPAAPAKPERWKPPASTDTEIADGWAPYERSDAPKWFVDRLREWWPPFEPGVVEHWIRLQKEITNLRRELGADRRTHEEFHSTRLTWCADDLVAYMEEIRMIPKRAQRAKPGRPRKRAMELDVDQWIAAQLTVDPTFRHLSQKAAAARGPFSARAIGTSPVWQRMKRQLVEEAEAEAERARAEFEDRLGEDEEQPGIRVGRKSALGHQRTTQKDRDHDRAAEHFLRNAEAHQKRKK